MRKYSTYPMNNVSADLRPTVRTIVQSENCLLYNFIILLDNETLFGPEIILQRNEKMYMINGFLRCTYF